MTKLLMPLLLLLSACVCTQGRKACCEPAASPFVGTWEETWTGRPGCKDTIRITRARGGLQVTGADCNDGTAYEISEVRADDKTLSFKLFVPLTGYSLRYVLKPGVPGILLGEVSGSASARVTWHQIDAGAGD